MVEARVRGYFGIGAEGVSKSANIGALLRTGHAFGASFCFTDRDRVGCARGPHGGYRRYAPPRADVALSNRGRPVAAARVRLVGIELLENAIDLPSFRHPLNAAYVLGPERAGLVGFIAAAVRSHHPHPHSVRTEPGGGRGLGALRPAAAARTIPRPAGGFERPPAGARHQPATGRRGSARQYRTGCARLGFTRTRRSHERARACSAYTAALLLRA